MSDPENNNEEAKITEEAKPKPLLEQMREEWMKLAARDGQITNAMNREREARFRIKMAKQDIQMRLAHLRAVAVETIQRRNGIRVIPGFVNPDAPNRKDIYQMSEQLRKLIKESGYVMPPLLLPPEPKYERSDPSSP